MPMKHQQLHTSKHVLEYTKTLKQFEKLAKPVKFHLMDKNNLEVQVSQEAFKKILTKDSMFDIPFLELRTIFKIL